MNFPLIPGHDSIGRMTTAGPDQKPFTIRSLTFSVYLPSFLFAIGQGAIFPIVPLFAKDLGASLAIAGLIVAVRGIGILIMDLPGGIFVARFGEKAGMLAGTTLVAAVAAAAAFSPSPIVLGILMLVMGAGWSLWQLARLSYVSQIVPNEQRGRAIALLGGVSRGGTFVGPIIGGILASAFGLEFALHAQAVAAVATGVLIFLMVTRTSPAERLPSHSIGGRLLSTVTDHRRVLLTTGAPIVALAIIRQGRQIFLPLWGDELELDVATISFIFALSYFVDMAMFYPVGVVMDKWGRKFTGVPSLIFLALGLLLLPLTSEIYGYVAIALLVGFGNGLGSGIVMTLGSDLAPARGRAEFLGVWRLIADLGNAGGPLTISLITGVASLAAASVASGGLGLVGAFLMLVFVKETLKRGPRYAPDPPTKSPDSS